MHNSFYNVFIWILYMFRATLCSFSGGQLYEYNFWYNHSVLAAVRYRTPANTEDSNKHIIGEIVRQVGHLQELYEDSKSEKYKIYIQLMFFH
jgi:hypothetical protein